MIIDPLKSWFYRRYRDHDVEKPDDIVLNFYCRLVNRYDRRIGFTKYYIETKPHPQRGNGKIQVRPDYLRHKLIVFDSLQDRTTNMLLESTLCNERGIVYLDMHEPKDGTLVFPITWRAPNDLCVIQCALYLETDDGIRIERSCQLLRYDWKKEWFQKLKVESKANRAVWIPIDDDINVYCWIGSEWEIRRIGQGGNFCHLVVAAEKPCVRSLNISVSEKSHHVLFDGAESWVQPIDPNEGFYIFKQRVTIVPSVLKDSCASIVVNLDDPSSTASFDVTW